MRNIDVFDVHGCIVKDEEGAPLARLEEVDGKIRVERYPACGIGEYFYILWYLEELGWETE